MSKNRMPNILRNAPSYISSCDFFNSMKYFDYLFEFYLSMNELENIEQIDQCLLWWKFNNYTIIMINFQRFWCPRLLWITYYTLWCSILKYLNFSNGWINEEVMLDYIYYFSKTWSKDRMSINFWLPLDEYYIKQCLLISNWYLLLPTALDFISHWIRIFLAFWNLSFEVE